MAAEMETPRGGREASGGAVENSATADSTVIVTQDEAARTAALAEHRAKVAAADAKFQALRRAFRAKDFELLVTAAGGDAEFLVCRWGYVHQVPTLAALGEFAALVGVKL